MWLVKADVVGEQLRVLSEMVNCSPCITATAKDLNLPYSLPYLYSLPYSYFCYPGYQYTVQVVFGRAMYHCKSDYIHVLNLALCSQTLTNQPPPVCLQLKVNAFHHT